MSDKYKIIVILEQCRPVVAQSRRTVPSGSRTIIVNNVAEYKVHRLALGKRPRNSGYFETLFASHLGEDRKQSTIHIELEKELSKMFPVLMDFIYNGELDSSIPADNLFCLFSLADYFEIEALQTSLICICAGDLDTLATGESELNTEKLAFYLSKAEENRDTGNIYQALVEKCASSRPG